MNKLITKLGTSLPMSVQNFISGVDALSKLTRSSIFQAVVKTFLGFILLHWISEKTDFF